MVISWKLKLRGHFGGGSGSPVALAGCGVLLAVNVVVGYQHFFARQSDERLIGTWQSDADRTIAGLRERRPMEEKFYKLFGKLRVTYTDATYTTELDESRRQIGTRNLVTSCPR